MADLKLCTFADAAAFSQWLEANGEASPGVRSWARFAERGQSGLVMSTSSSSGLTHLRHQAGLLSSEVSSISSA